MTTWQDIETAPRDGTFVDLWRKDHGRLADCYWGRPSHECGESGQYCDSDWHSLDEGWVDGTFDHLIPGDDITHWMPLPSPPSKEGE